MRCSQHCHALSLAGMPDWLVFPQPAALKANIQRDEASKDLEGNTEPGANNNGVVDIAGSAWILNELYRGLDVETGP